MKKDVCRLCGVVAELQESHVIPGFVYKYIKDNSGSGYLRFGQNPNRRSQDGHKSRWLCNGCEQRFNKWETQFSRIIFHPINQDQTVNIQYSSWFLLFCVSVSWRVLNYYEDIGLQLPEKFLKSVKRAKSVWKEFLLNQRSHPEKYEQHFLTWDVITNHSFPNMPKNINRYILLSTDTDTVHGEKSAFIYSKLGRFLILGFIEEPNFGQWKGTKVHVKNGIIKPQEYTFPYQFRDYLQEKARRMEESQSRISEKQNKKIEEEILKNPSRVANSESFKAMIHDVRLFGDAAFRKKE